MNFSIKKLKIIVCCLFVKKYTKDKGVRINFVLLIDILFCVHNRHFIQL